MVRKTEGHLKFALTNLKLLAGMPIENVRTYNLKFQIKVWLLKPEKYHSNITIWFCFNISLS